MFYYFIQTFKTMNYITMSIGSVYFYKNLLYTRKHSIKIIKHNQYYNYMCGIQILRIKNVQLNIAQRID